MREEQARRELVESGLRLSRAGLVARSWGNLSLRLEGGAMAVTPSGIPYADLREGMIVLVDLATGEWSGDWKPTSERKLHREIYLRRPEVGAIVHTHQSAASACAAARSPVPVPRGTVPCAAYALPGTKAFTRSVADSLGAGSAVLLANHGVAAVGATMDETFDAILGLESSCAEYIEARDEGSLPVRADEPWNPSWLSPVRLGDGSAALASAAPYTLAWSAEEGEKRVFLDDLAQMAGPRIRLLSRAPERLPECGIVLMKGAGALVGGPDAEAAAMVVEKAARAALCGRVLGGAVPIPAWEARLMRFVYKQSYAKRAKKAAAK
jgi:L-fuculose-phosphate aldolase